MQLSLLFDTAQTPRAYTAADSRKAGEIAGQRVADRAERDADGFRARAQAFVLGYLAQHGVSSGELVTQACKLAGIKVPRRLGDWAMWEIRLIRRLQPRFNRTMLKARVA